MILRVTIVNFVVVFFLGGAFAAASDAVRPPRQKTDRSQSVSPNEETQDTDQDDPIGSSNSVHLASTDAKVCCAVEEDDEFAAESEGEFSFAAESFAEEAKEKEEAKKKAEAAKKAAKDAKPAAMPKPWKALFYDNDFSFLENPDHPYVVGEAFKDRRPCCCSPWVASAGGEVRFRFMDDDNRFRPGYPIPNNQYQLWRWRQYFDVHYSDYFRVYFEGLHGDSFGEDVPPLGIDVDRWEYTNAFFDLIMGRIGNNTNYFRAGRQELLYGAQRLISPLDWSNTRRTFEGYKAFSHGDEWDLDVWATRPVIVDPNNYNQTDFSRTLSGAWYNYHGFKKNIFDLFWIYDREQDPIAVRADGSRQTVGGRWQFKQPVKNCCDEVVRTWLSEVEGAYQFGNDNGQTVRAGFLTAGVGHQWNNVSWKPSLWCYYDWASGDRDPFDNETNTFNQLFPLGHAYLGWFDAVGRQNIRDYNVRLTLAPNDRWALVAWMHYFNLDKPTDAFYNVAGVPFARNAPGSNRVDVGEEFDMIAKYRLNINADIALGYSWFWVGNMLRDAGRTENGRLLYCQTHLRY